MISNAVRIAQERLLAWGKDIGPSGVDGIKGNATTAAVKAFQKQQGLPANGALDSATLGALLKTPPPQQRPNMRPPPDELNPTQPTGIMPPPRLRENINSFTPQAPAVSTPSGPPPGAIAQPPAPQVDPQVLNYAQGFNPGASVAPGIDFPTLVRMGLTQGSRSLEAKQRWRADPSQGGMGQPGFPQQTMVGQAPQMANPPTATPDQRAAATSQLRGLLAPPPAPTPPGANVSILGGMSNQGQPPPMMDTAPPPAIQQPFQPSPGNPGVGLPGQPPAANIGTMATDALGNAAKAAQGILSGQADFASRNRDAIGNAIKAQSDFANQNLGAIGGVANELFGIKPAQGGPGQPPPQTAQSWLPQGQMEAQLKKRIEAAIWNALLGARIAPPQSDPSLPPTTGFTTPTGPYR